MLRKSALPWQGRVDNEDGDTGCRWHQQVSYDQKTFSGAPVFIGFCCDEGVRRNQGRVGAREGPLAIRKYLSNLSCDTHFSVHDLGDIYCDGDLEGAQEALSDEIETILFNSGFPVILGGGHEVAWASFLGAQKFLAKQKSKATLGIINFDAHFDLRNPLPKSSSGTPFRQCYNYCAENSIDFSYLVAGVNRSANTKALFDFADSVGVMWVEDCNVSPSEDSELLKAIAKQISKIDYLYLTICLDVFSAASAPGVSAPASLGISPMTCIKIIKAIKNICKKTNTRLLLCDVAEMNPQYDIDGRTAGLAARLIYEIVNDC